MSSAIHGAGLAGVGGELRGGSTLFVNITNDQGEPADFVGGYAAVAGISSFFLPAVKDLAGNSLKPNQATNDTVFTILTPGVQLDFGDAPDPFRADGRYPTLFKNNGARHVVTSSPSLPRAGQARDAETDGQPTDRGRGDDGTASTTRMA